METEKVFQRQNTVCYSLGSGNWELCGKMGHMGCFGHENNMTMVLRNLGNEEKLFSVA